MTRGSIRWRMMLAGGIAIITALALAAIGLSMLFDRHVQRIAQAELQSRALTVATMIEPGGSRGPSLRQTPLDPRYDQVFSGHYWQVQLGQRQERSRSLWDSALHLPAIAPAPGRIKVLAMAGPQDQPLIALMQDLRAGNGAQALPLRIVVAMPRREIDLARRGFLGDLLPYLSMLGALLLAASFVQITVGLRPLAQVGARVAQLANGTRPRIGTDMPAEVIPLASEIDKLLDARDHELARARHRAADLAHGFKTPLQALLGDAAQLRDKGEAELADSIENVAVSMRRHVDRELARARIQSGRGDSSADPAVILPKLVEVLRRTPLGAMIDWRIDAVEGLRARIDPDDLTEALGALMENAMRHCNEVVAVTVQRVGGEIIIRVRDDGRGVPEGDLARLTQRGLSLDPDGDGQGIGLAVVAGVVDAARGQLRMRNTHPGLEVEMVLDAA